MMILPPSVDVVEDITMLTKNDVIITRFLIRNPYKRFSIREIARQVGVDYKLIYNAVKRLKQKKIIISYRHGKTELCGLSFKETSHYLAQVEGIQTKDFLEKQTGMKLIIEDIKKHMKNPYYTLILFGSFSKGKQHKRSDVDILLIVPEKGNIKQAEVALAMSSRTRPLKIHSHVVMAKDFVEMLSSKEELTLAKEVVLNHIIFYGAEAYYSLLEGVQ
jgi:predicted nucleotidyltransferase